MDKLPVELLGVIVLHLLDGNATLRLQSIAGLALTCVHLRELVSHYFWTVSCCPVAFELLITRQDVTLDEGMLTGKHMQTLLRLLRAHGHRIRTIRLSACPSNLPVNSYEDGFMFLRRRCWASLVCLVLLHSPQLQRVYVPQSDVDVIGPVLTPFDVQFIVMPGSYKRQSSHVNSQIRRSYSI